jgi:hypothetical protein
MPYRDFYAYYLMPWQQNQTGPRRFAEEVFEQLPPGAVLLPDSTTSPPLKCMHDIEGVRPDVLIVDPYDAGFEPAYRQWWQGDADLLPEFAANGRRVFVTSDYASYIPRWVAARTRLDPAGKIWEVLPRGKEGPP